MKLKSGNIWSGDPHLAVFTNMTELAFRKGNLKNHYPVFYEGIEYVDAEAAYQALSKGHKHDLSFLKKLMVEIIAEKLRQYPKIRQTITDSGGEKWIGQCSHIVSKFGSRDRWQGHGKSSGFICCLWRAYVQSA